MTDDTVMTTAAGVRAPRESAALSMQGETFAGFTVKFRTEKDNWDLVGNSPGAEMVSYAATQMQNTIGERHGHKD